MVTNVSLSYLAYVGPGAGFAASASLCTGLLLILSMAMAPFLWPALSLLRLLRRRRLQFPHGQKRIVVLGLDRLDPTVLRQMMEAESPDSRATGISRTFRPLFPRSHPRPGPHS